MTGFFAPSEVQKEKPLGLAPKCGACGLYLKCQSPKMEVWGQGKRKVLVVGEAPGQTEDDEGRPFIGKAGQFLRDTLEQIEIDLDQDCWVTNSLICRPPNNATPDLKQIEYCRPNLLNTINRLFPNVVVLLGRSAVSSLMPVYWKDDVGTLERWVGWQIPGPSHWICPTYHPSFLLRSNSSLLNRMFQDHLDKAFSIKENSFPPTLPHVQCLYETDEVEQAIFKLLDSEWIAFDYETNCLKPEYPKARLYSCSLSDGKTTVAFPWNPPNQYALARLLRNKGIKKIASNLKFEERWTKRAYGYGVANWGWDTMLSAHCLDNRPGICSLKFQSWVKLGVPTYNGHIAPYLESKRGWYNRIEQIALQDLLFYNGVDAYLEHKLAMQQRKEMGL
jgi:uracil-DNA glycosylase